MDNAMSIELKYCIRALRKRIAILLLFPVITAVISAFVSFFILQPEYESNLTLYLINKKSSYILSGSYSDALINRQLIKDFSEIIKSKKNLNDIIKTLNLDEYTPGKLAERITIKFRDDTNIIEIKVWDNSPQTAKRVTERIGILFKDKLVEFTELLDVQRLDDAEIPQKAARPKPAFNIAIAFFIGLLVVTGAILFVEYINDTIKTYRDVEKHLALPVLGNIPIIDLD